jgi:hypothetical protein
MKEYSDNDEIYTHNISEEKNTNDLYGMCYDIISSINYKSLFFLYIIYVLLSTNIFSKYILEQKNIDDKHNLDYIILVKGLYLVFIFMLILILLKINIL